MISKTENSQLNFNFDQLINQLPNYQIGYLKTIQFLHICDQHIKACHNIEKRKFLSGGCISNLSRLDTVVLDSTVVIESGVYRSNLLC